MHSACPPLPFLQKGCLSEWEACGEGCAGAGTRQVFSLGWCSQATPSIVRERKGIFVLLKTLDPTSCLYWKVKCVRNEHSVHLRNSSLFPDWGALAGVKLSARWESAGMLLPAPACFTAETSLPSPSTGSDPVTDLLKRELCAQRRAVKGWS